MTLRPAERPHSLKRNDLRFPLSMTLEPMTPSPLSRLSLALSLIGALGGCNDRVSPSEDFLITSERLELPAPSARLGYSTKSVFITNISGRDVTLSRVRLKEADETPELTLRTAERPLEDAPLKLAKGQSLALEVRWRPEDASPDQATIEITSPRTQRVIEVSTPALDPELSVMLAPAGVPTRRGQSVYLETAPGLTHQVEVTLLAQVGIPVEVSALCVSDEEGDCLDALPDPLELCATHDREGCAPLSSSGRVTSSAPLEFALRFSPDREVSGSLFIAVKSDAARAPRYLIKVTYATCERDRYTPTCGSCGDGVVDADRGEVCDDANLDPHDACGLDCQPSCALDGSCPAQDSDQDGVADDEDNCPRARNTDQADCDADGVGDLCDPDACPAPPADADGDTIVDAIDNCPRAPNVDQSDRDGDGLGDVCDERPDERDFLLHSGRLFPNHASEGDERALRGELSSGAHRSETPEYQLTGVLRP